MISSIYCPHVEYCGFIYSKDDTNLLFIDIFGLHVLSVCIQAYRKCFSCCTFKFVVIHTHLITTNIGILQNSSAVDQIFNHFLLSKTKRSLTNIFYKVFLTAVEWIGEVTRCTLTICNTGKNGGQLTE